MVDIELVEALRTKIALLQVRVIDREAGALADYVAFMRGSFPLILRNLNMPTLQAVGKVLVEAHQRLLRASVEQGLISPETALAQALKIEPLQN